MLSKCYHLCGIITPTIKDMFHFIHFIGHNLQSIVEQGGYFFLFVTTVLEGIPIIGQFIPGHTIVILSGFLAKIHVLNVVKVTIIVIGSALIGDIIGFILGKKYGMDFLTKFGSFFFIKKEYIEKAAQLVKEHPAKTIMLGRFSPITRPLSPFIVGASGTAVGMFWLYDFIAVCAWSIVSIAIGYIFGASYHAASAVFGKFIFIALIVGILIVLAYRFINKQFHIFAKYELITLGLNLLGLYIFFKTVQDAITDKVFLLELDLFTNDYFLLNAHEPWLTLFNTVTNILSPVSITVICCIGIIYFIYKKKHYYTLITTLSLVGGYLGITIVKYMVERLRPEHGFIIQNGFSFPSAHAVIVTIFFTLLIYIFVIKTKSLIKREIAIVGCVVLVLLTAFSRVYLGVHWLSDVIAGIGFGLFWTTLVILTLKYGKMIVAVLQRKFRD